MNTPLLFAGAVIAWGLTPLAIKNQLGFVAPEMLVAYRFGLGAVLLLGWCLWQGRRLRFTVRQHCFIALPGVLLFSFPDIGVYNAIAYVTSGLVPLIYSLLPVTTMFFGALLIGLRVRARVVVAGFLGLAGIGMVFWPELAGLDLTSGGLIGLGATFAGMLSQALGNIVATRNFRAGLPILETAALGMVYGAAASLVISLALGGVPAWSFSPGFLAGYLWVAVVGTAVAFMCYLVLLGRIGPERVAYIVVVVPVVALIVSTIFEGYEWTVLSSAGAAVVLFGSVLALTTPRTAPAAAGSAP